MATSTSDSNRRQTVIDCIQLPVLVPGRKSNNLSVIPYNGSPTRKRASPLVIGLGICGGCGLVAVIIVVALGMWAVTKSKGIIGGIVQQREQPILFFKAIKVHDYAAAENLMSLEGQKALPEDQLKKLCEDTEHKLGPLQGWSSQPEIGSSSTDSTSYDDSTTHKESFIKHRPYHIFYQRGIATATFSFTSNTHLTWSKMISNFNITTGGNASGMESFSTPSDHTGRSGENVGVPSKNESSNDFNQ